MAYKHLLLLILAVAVVKAESDCNCENYPEGEEKELWKFLKEMSEEYPNPEDKDLTSVLPGVLSPLLECNCLEKGRRKRKIMPEVDEFLVEAPKHVAHVRRNSARFADRRCPAGFVRIGIMCLPEEYLE